jgi:hypothetical protein
MQYEGGPSEKSNDKLQQIEQDHFVAIVGATISLVDPVAQVLKDDLMEASKEFFKHQDGSEEQTKAAQELIQKRDNLISSVKQGKKDSELSPQQQQGIEALRMVCVVAERVVEKAAKVMGVEEKNADKKSYAEKYPKTGKKNFVNEISQNSGQGYIRSPY